MEEIRELISAKSGVPTIVFGDGCVEISSGFIDDPEIDHGVVSFKAIPKTKVGAPTGREYNEDGSYHPTTFPDSEFKLVFKNVEGLNVLLEKLYWAKHYMSLTEKD